eukprot:3418909-Alexandrium_andersonii.AAC.1
MSASLVGSEMCIRDSASPAALSMPSNRERHSSERRTPAAGRRSRTRLPVSYTHLTLPTICSV